MSRREQIRAAMDKHDKPIAKTTTGKGKHYLPTDQGAPTAEAFKESAKTAKKTRCEHIEEACSKCGGK